MEIIKTWLGLDIFTNLRLTKKPLGIKKFNTSRGQTTNTPANIVILLYKVLKNIM